MCTRTYRPDGRTPHRNLAGRALAWVLVAVLAGSAAATAFSEDDVKAGYLYKFLLFVEWPPDARRDDADPATICIAGGKSLTAAFEKVKDRPVEGRPLAVRHLDDQADAASLRRCHVLFIRAPLSGRADGILQAVRGYPVLVVGEAEGFAYARGMINLVTRKNSVGFEINRGAAESEGLKPRGQLLRVADRIIGERHGR
jgi:hypothetical protein